MALLRIPMIPAELPPHRREMVMLAGRGAYYHAARMPAAAKPAFELLVQRYPDAPNVHYAYGVFLLERGSRPGDRRVPAGAEDVSGSRPVDPADCVRVPEAIGLGSGEALGAARRRPRSPRFRGAARASDRCCSRPATHAGSIEQLEIGRQAGARQPIDALHARARLPEGRARRRTPSASGPSSSGSNGSSAAGSTARRRSAASGTRGSESGDHDR